MLDQIILTPKCPFQLSSNVFEYLKGHFIFYDLTTKNFLKAIHYSLLRHYSQGNAYAICATTFSQSSLNILDKLKSNDLEAIRRLHSFRSYVESMTDYAGVISILTDDSYFRRHLIILVHNIYKYLFKFYGYIRFLWILVRDLPGEPLGKRLSDVYSLCHPYEKCITDREDFHKSWQLLNLLTKTEFVLLLRKCCGALQEYKDTYLCGDEFKIDSVLADDVTLCFNKTFDHIDQYIKELMQETPKSTEEGKISQSNTPQMYESRQSFYQKLNELKQSETNRNDKMIAKILDYIRKNVIEEYMPSQRQAPPLLELFVYADYDSIRSHLRGTSRSAIHTCLTNPNYYVQVSFYSFCYGNKFCVTMTYYFSFSV